MHLFACTCLSVLHITDSHNSHPWQPHILDSCVLSDVEQTRQTSHPGDTLQTVSELEMCGGHRLLLQAFHSGHCAEDQELCAERRAR